MPEYININDNNVFRSLVEQYYTALFLFADRMVGNADAATDIVQEAFACLWERRGKISDGQYARNYLYTVVRNRSVDYCRRNWKHVEIPNHMPDTDDISLGIVRSETMRILNEAIDALPPRNANVIRMTLDGIKQEEIAQSMGIQVRTVKALKAEGIRKLKESLGAGLLLALICSPAAAVAAADDDKAEYIMSEYTASFIDDITAITATAEATNEATDGSNTAPLRTIAK